jgi:hypothetical protein
LQCWFVNDELTIESFESDKSELLLEGTVIMFVLVFLVFLFHSITHWLSHVRVHSSRAQLTYFIIAASEEVTHRTLVSSGGISRTIAARTDFVLIVCHFIRRIGGRTSSADSRKHTHDPLHRHIVLYYIHYSIAGIVSILGQEDAQSGEESNWK